MADYLYWLNLFALVLAAVGSLTLAIYGFPNLRTISPSAFSVIDETTQQMMRAQFLSKVGLWLLGGGVILQATAQVREISFA